MGYYLFQGAYTSESWAAMIRNPQSRVEAVQPVVERLGGRMETAWFSFGEYDVVALLDMPDNVSAAAFSAAVAAGGGVKAAKTTPLLTVEEGIAVMRKAGTAGYRPPQ